MRKIKIISELFAFTLAEILIVVGIIGIIAQMTIPQLVADFQVRSTVTALKKAHSTISQAYTLAVQENGTPDTWGLTVDSVGAQLFLNIFAPYLRITKNCGTGPGCFPNLTYKDIKGSDYAYWDLFTDRARAQLFDGTLIMFNTNSATSGSLGQIYVDINGAKAPNQLGKDFFYFRLYKDKVVPAGSPITEGNQAFVDNCMNNYGFGCAAWVIYNENMDYLKCDDLSWDGKTKCD